MPRLVLPAEPDALASVHELLDGLWAETGDAVGRDARDRFALALVEVVGNVVEHGRTPAGGVPTLEIDLEASGGVLVARLADDGAEVPDPGRDELPDPLAESGRGLPLAHAAVDEVRYVREEGRNHWTLLLRPTS